MQLVISQDQNFDEELDRATEVSNLSFETQMEYFYRVFGAMVKLDFTNIPKEINEVFCRFVHSNFKDVIVEYHVNKAVILHGDSNALINLLAVYFSQDSFLEDNDYHFSSDMTIKQMIGNWNQAFASNPMTIKKDTPILRFPVVIMSPAGFVGHPMNIQQGELEISMKHMEAAMRHHYGIQKVDIVWNIVDGVMVFVPTIDIKDGELTLSLSNV